MDRRTSLKLFASAIVATACAPATQTGSSTAAPQPTGPFEVVVGVPAEATMIDVHQRAVPADRIITSMIFDNLLMSQYPSDAPGPGLAERWEVAPDGLSLTMQLRRGVKFHDGTPLDAEAMKFSLDRQLDTTNEFNKIGKFPLVAGFTGNLKMPLVVVDANTIRVNFKERLAPDINLEYFTADSYAIVSPTAVRAAKDKFPDKPIGTGPYRFVSWEKGQRTVLERNPDYWGPKPAADRIIIVPIRDADARMSALKAGTIDINSEASGDQLEAIRSDSKFAVSEKLSRHFFHVHFNQKLVPELRDKRVRQAFNYAVDKEAIVKDILRGQAVVAKSFMSPAFNDYHASSLPGFARDLNKAKQLLSDAGFPGGRGFPALAMKLPSDAALSGKPVAIAEAVQANLADIGVKITIESMAMAQWVTQVTLPNTVWQLAAQSPTGTRFDPDNYLRAYVQAGTPPSFANYGYYSNSEVERLYTQSRVELDRAKRVQLVQRFQQIVSFEDPGTLMIDHAKLAAVYNKSRVDKVQMFTDVLNWTALARP